MTTPVPASHALRCGDRTVATLVVRPRVPGRCVPRPHLHPVTTRAGVAVTESGPADHRHHLGVCVAVPDVGHHNFWGGRTFVRGAGPTELDDHGVQHHTRFTTLRPDTFTEELSWRAGGAELLAEQRTVTARPLTDQAWALDLAFTLTNTCGSRLSLGSPATNGRPGAGYGGFFWRARRSAEAPRVFTADAAGEDAVHGRRAPWLALTGADWSLVFAAGDETTCGDPWFVRAAEYPGVGSSLAAATRLPLPPGARLTRRVVTVVADGPVGRREAADLASRAVAR
ncbi:PmoA family protein [Streptomyces sp. NPDC059740]|uniref:DUF6807 domain-containing protein n=1 Tax=Streptomyces sp. NPDC059740 TaxID=3346926 RepID=UPI00364F8078